VTPDDRIAILERQVRGLRLKLHELAELCDTVNSPPWKRLWWFLCGYRMWRVGVWYRARWNRDGWGA